MNLSFYKKRFYILIFLLSIAFSPIASFGEVIILKDGNKIEDYITGMDSEKLQLLKKGELNKKDVKELYFSTKEHKAETGKAVDDKEIKAILAEADEFQKKYPDQNGLVLLDDGYFEYNKDGTTLYRYHYRFKILKDVRKSDANQTFYFNEGREQINIVLARTISADGEVFNLDPETINISQPTESSSSFSTYKALSFTIPNAEVGSIIEYVMEMHEYKPFEKKFFFPGFGFQGDLPMLTSRLTVVIPENEKLYYVFNNFDEAHKKPTVLESNGKKSYVWAYENMEPIISETNMPAFQDVVPYVICSLFDDWDVLFKWSKGFLKDKIAVTDAIKKKTAEVTAGSANDEERVAKIYWHIQNEIRYISIKSGIGSGYAGHAAQETLQNEYGDCIDKAILFTAMLKAINVEAYPIILNTNDSSEMERRLPNFNSNHAITKVILNGKTLFLDTTAQYFRFPYFQSADHGIWALNPLEQKFEYIPVPPPEDNAEISVSYCKIDDKGNFEVNKTTRFTGSTESSEWFYMKHLRSSDLERYITNFLNSISPGSKLKYYTHISSDNYKDSMLSDMGYILKNYGITAGDLVILSLPGIERTFGEIALEKRKYPLEFTTSFQQKKEFVIDLQGNYKVKYLPAPLRLDTKYFSYNMEYKEENGKITFTEDYKGKERLVPLDAYDTYRKAHKEIEKALKDKIFLTKAK